MDSQFILVTRCRQDTSNVPAGSEISRNRFTTKNLIIIVGLVGLVTSTLCKLYEENILLILNYGLLPSTYL
jgi:hypothetical protein